MAKISRFSQDQGFAKECGRKGGIIGGRKRWAHKKPSDDTIRSIRRHAAMGLSNWRIAKLLRMRYEIVWRIVTGRSYSYIQ